MKALLWKEYRLQKNALLIGLTSIPLAIIIFYLFDFPQFLIFLVLMISGLSVIIGGSSIAGEVERKTITFLVERPVNLRKIWLSKLIVGAALILIIQILYHILYYILYLMQIIIFLKQAHFRVFTSALIIGPYAAFAVSFYFSAILNKSIEAASIGALATIAGFALIFGFAFDAIAQNTQTKIIFYFVPLEILALALLLFFLSYVIFSKKFSNAPHKKTLLAYAITIVIFLCALFFIPILNYGLYSILAEINK